MCLIIIFYYYNKMDDIYIKMIENSLIKANNDYSKLNEELIDIFAMSGKRTRHFNNNLLGYHSLNLLEIGAYTGISTSCAMYKNKSKIAVIDNFSVWQC